MHKNVLETFVDEELTSSFPPSYATDDNADLAVTIVTDPKTASDDFFDNDSFWSGQITWY